MKFLYISFILILNFAKVNKQIQKRNFQIMKEIYNRYFYFAFIVRSVLPAYFH